MEHPRWIEWVSRLGIRAKGLVYVVVGVLAIQTSVEARGRTKDPQQALTDVSHRPFGMFLIGMIAFGLIGFVVWCFLQAIADPEKRARGWQGWLRRASFVCVAGIYGSLAYGAFTLLLGARRIARGMQPKDWTQLLLEEPMGRWLVVAVGLAVLGLGLFQIVQGVTGSFLKNLEVERMKPAQRRTARIVGAGGLGARGVTFILIGVFFVRAARDASPREAKGLSGAFSELARREQGQLLVGLLAFGFVLYGAYMLIEAGYRRFRPAAPAG